MASVSASSSTPVKQPTLSSRINSYTRKAHERDRIISSIKLILCLIDPILYGRLVRQFYEMYETLENEIQRHIKARTPAGRIFERVVMEEVFREEAFIKDLKYWCGADWRDWEVTGQMQRYKV